MAKKLFFNPALRQNLALCTVAKLRFWIQDFSAGKRARAGLMHALYLPNNSLQTPYKTSAPAALVAVGVLVKDCQIWLCCTLVGAVKFVSLLLQG